MRKNIKIAKMELAHLSDVADIEKDLFHNPWSSDMYKAELMKDYSYHYVVLYDDKVIGYYGFFLTTDEEAEVTNIAVSREYQGLGVGNEIMQNLLDNATMLGVNKIFLEVRFSNNVARHLYEKYNFSMINIRKKYYDGEEDACIYMWQR